MVQEGCSIPMLPGCMGSCRLDPVPSHPEAAFSKEGRWRPLGSDQVLQHGEGGVYSSHRCLKSHLLSLREQQTWGYIPTLLLIGWGCPQQVIPLSGPHSLQEGISGSITGPRVSQHCFLSRCNFKNTPVPPLQDLLSSHPVSPSSVLSPSLDTPPLT